MAEFEAIESKFHFNGDIAALFSIPAALLFGHIHWSIKSHREYKVERFWIEGRWWMFNSLVEFTRIFPFLSLPTIKRAIKSLRDAKLVITLESRGGLTNYYAIDYAIYRILIDRLKMNQVQNEPHPAQNEPGDLAQNEPHPAQNEPSPLCTKFKGEKTKGEGRGKKNPPPIVSNLKLEHGIGSGDTPPEAGRHTPDDAKSQSVQTEPPSIEDSPESLLTPFLVWRIRTEELLTRRGITAGRMTPTDNRYACELIRLEKSEDGIRRAIRTYVLTDKEFYQQRVWPLKALVEDIEAIRSSKVLKQLELKEKADAVRDERAKIAGWKPKR